jgi:hypothetical protein
MIETYLPIPYSFVRERVRLNWSDVQLGLLRGYLEPRGSIDLAVEMVGVLDKPSESIIALAGISIRDPTFCQQALDIVNQLAERESETDKASGEAAWLYLLLAWLYEQRDLDSDPLQLVEIVYADFDYPEEMAPFVRYMPMVGPDLGTVEACTQRLFERCKQFVIAKEQLFAQR